MGLDWGVMVEGLQIVGQGEVVLWSARAMAVVRIEREARESDE